MNSYTQILYQITFATKLRQDVLDRCNQEVLYHFLAKLLTKKRCIVHAINGVEDHLHIVLYLHPSLSLASAVKDIKLASSKFIKENQLFPNFDFWQRGYAAFTYNSDALENLIKYVENQEEHHRNMSSKDELVNLLAQHNIQYDPKYFD